MCLEIVSTAHYNRFYFYLSNKCAIYDVEFFSSLLHSYMFRCVNVITRGSLCISKLLRLFYAYWTVHHLDI